MDRPARSAAWLTGLVSFSAVCVVAVGVHACLPDLPIGQCGDGQIEQGEQCDPGQGQTNAGCNQYCQIVCPNPPDQSSNHCYFSLSTSMTYAEALSACDGDLEAHVVTFVDDDELGDVVGEHLLSKNDERFWAGLSLGAGGAYYSAAAQTEYEPGWVVPPCGGCFIHGGGLVADAGIDSGPDPGAPSGVADLNPQNANGSMAVLGANVKAGVICEREPVGARSAPCNGDNSYCFELLATQSANAAQSKRYLYHPAAMTASAAESYCEQLSVDGSPSLVILNSQAEREQLIYELTQLRRMGGPLPPQSFWIGLVGVTLPGSAVVWQWLDGVANGKTSFASPPRIWGGSVPPAPDYPGSYAYIVLDDGDAYDTGLAHVVRADSNGPYTYPFVCQYLY
jgi:cysteine-rich repeat protein